MDLKGTVFEDWWEALPALKRTPVLIDEIIDEAWEKDKELTMRFLFFTRDIKEGVGAREARAGVSYHRSPQSQSSRTLN